MLGLRFTAKGKRVGLLALLIAALVVGLTGPAVVTAASAQPDSPCGALAANLQKEPQDALAQLKGATPNVEAAMDRLFDMTSTMDDLKANDCVAKIPPAPGVDVTKCIHLDVDLLSGVFSGLSGLTSGGTPDIGALVGIVTKLVSTLTKLVDLNCILNAVKPA